MNTSIREWPKTHKHPVTSRQEKTSPKGPQGGKHLRYAHLLLAKGRFETCSWPPSNSSLELAFGRNGRRLEQAFMWEGERSASARRKGGRQYVFATAIFPVEGYRRCIEQSCTRTPFRFSQAQITYHDACTCVTAKLSLQDARRSVVVGFRSIVLLTSLVSKCA